MKKLFINHEEDNQVKKLFLNHPVIFYYIIVLFVSAILLYPMILFNSPLVQIQYAPAISVLIFFLITGKNELYTPLIKSFTFTPSLFKLLLTIIITALLPCIAISFSLSALGIPYSPWDSTLLGYFIISLEIFVGVVFEEIGWRGFLLPLLCKRHSLFKSSLIVGVLWGIWHISAYSSYGVLACILFFLSVIAFSIIISFFYAKGKGNLILAIATHFFINLFSKILILNRMSTTSFALYTLFFGITCLLIVHIERKSFYKFDKFFTT